MSSDRDGGDGAFGGTPTERALMKAHRAVARMRKSVQKSLDRVSRVSGCGGRPRSVEARYGELDRRMAVTWTALNTMAAFCDAADENDQGTPSRPPGLHEVVALLARAYRLEEELADVDKERDELMRAAAVANDYNCAIF